jgi:L-lactate dehydrogenase complex protein LldF
MNVHAKEFTEDARRNTGDARQRQFIQKALDGYYIKRDESKNRFQSWPGARNVAAEIKWDAINHLDSYLQEFASKLEARGAKVFWAGDAASARDYILRLAREHKVRSVIKSKSMATEEIHLNEALEKEGLEVVESDLGEYIVQLRKEPPYHFVFPAMHLRREQISDLFHDKLGSAPTNSPEELTMIARGVMRRKFCAADMGVTGANFMVAETGMISITENEGNARLTAALPKIHVAVVGIEKVLPKLADLALFLPMLATAGTGQALTCYNTLYGAARLPDEADGPREFHVVLLDNRRTQLLADAEQRDALHCIRCGACLNVCPIFKNVGGFTYGTTYQGPIGAVITPHLRGLQSWKHLSYASSLCGACTEACPVKINLHHHLLQSRRNAAQAEPSWTEKMVYRLFAFVMQRPRVYQLATELGRFFQPLQGAVNGTLLDPLRPWTKTRSFPVMPQKSFRDLWRERSPQSGAEFQTDTTDTRTPASVTEHQISQAAPRREGRGASDNGPQGQRETILARIREALKISAPHPAAETPPAGSPQQWLPPVGPSLEEQIELFRQNAKNLLADFQVFADLDAVIQYLKTLAAAEGWRKVALHRGELTSAAAAALGLPQVQTDGGYALDDLETCSVGLTGCEALIAQTGSVLVSARDSGGRALSVLPPHHVVIARRSEMVSDLSAAFERVREKFQGNLPGYLSFITGCSRTGDIERILVLGAHGPKKLTILLLP